MNSHYMHIIQMVKKIHCRFIQKSVYIILCLCFYYILSILISVILSIKINSLNLKKFLHEYLLHEVIFVSIYSLVNNKMYISNFLF